MQQLVPLMRTAALAGLLFVAFDEYRHHDLSHAALALAIALLATR